MSIEIFKIYYINYTAIEKIDVYNGNTNYIGQNITDIYRSDRDIFDDIFTEEESAKIEEQGIPVFFLPTFIYIDDTIETIKKKIIENENIAFEELYLFCSYKGKLDSFSVYEYLTQGKKIDLSQLRLLQFLLNINEGHKFQNVPDKEIYNYSDILELKLDEEEFTN